MNQNDNREPNDEQTVVDDLTVEETQAADVKGSRGPLGGYDWQDNIKI